MKKLFLFLMLLSVPFGCHSKETTPKSVLDAYFTSAMKQDYATTYTCYYKEYKVKVSKDEYIRHRKDASVLQKYEIVSLKQEGDAARAEVLLTFAPSEKLKRTKPETVKVKEDLIKEGGEWKIKVW